MVCRVRGRAAHVWMTCVQAKDEVAWASRRANPIHSLC